MLVDVVRLRLNGRKLTEAEWLPPLRGDLALAPRKGAPLQDGTYGFEVVVVARLLDPAGEDILEPLEEAYVTHVRGDVVTVTGTERPERRGNIEAPRHHPQTWACRLFLAGPQPPL